MHVQRLIKSLIRREALLRIFRLHLFVSLFLIFPITKSLANNLEPALVGGTPTLAQEAVGHIGNCTATLISPIHILTASHCNAYLAHDTNIGTFTVEQPIANGGLRVIRRNIRLWIGQGRAVGEDDWGIGILDRPITEVVPARISARSPNVGEIVTAFGYGCTNRDTGDGSWQKRYREFAYGSNPKTLCPGDSGGPLMIGRHDNAIEIIGINSGFYTQSGVDIWANAVKYRDHIIAIHQGMPLGNVCYRAHVSGNGWLPMVCDGRTAGTVGQSRQMEAVQVYARAGNVCYRSHLTGIGWERAFLCDGQVSGTVGQNRRMEAFQISNISTPLMFQYRAHVSWLGWLPWVDEGFTAGTTGQSRALEALQINGF